MYVFGSIYFRPCCRQNVAKEGKKNVHDAHIDRKIKSENGKGRNNNRFCLFPPFSGEIVRDILASFDLIISGARLYSYIRPSLLHPDTFLCGEMCETYLFFPLPGRGWKTGQSWLVDKETLEEKYCRSKSPSGNP